MQLTRSLCCLLVLFASQSIHADDWPMWRSDAYRSAVSNGQLPAGKIGLSGRASFRSASRLGTIRSIVT